MKILQVHNFYQSNVPSGENDVVDAEAKSLVQAGVTVLRHTRSSDEIAHFGLGARSALPFRPLWSPSDLSRVRDLVLFETPDLMHLHNPNPLISMGVVRVAADCGLPVVMTVHNHRHTCLQSSFFRDGHACHDCRGRMGPLPAVRHGCYRESRAQSAILAAALVAHRPAWGRIRRFLATSSSIRDSLLRTGLVAPERVVVKANSVPDPGQSAEPPAGPLRVLFLGRLDEGKGVRLLLDAWDRGSPPGGRLTFVGAGPLEGEVRARAASRPDIAVLGQLDAGGVHRAVCDSHLLAVPSLVEEAFGLVVLEAYARSRPVVSTGAGGLADLVDDSCAWTIKGNVLEWAKALKSITVDEAAKRGAAGRIKYLTTYTPLRITSQLLGHYEQVLKEGRSSEAR